MEEQDKLELAYEEILQEVRPLPLISISRILGRAKLTAATSSLQLYELKRQRALDEVRLLTVAVPRDSAAQLTPSSRRASRSTRSPRKMQRMTVCVLFALVLHERALLTLAVARSTTRPTSRGTTSSSTTSSRRRSHRRRGGRPARAHSVEP